MWSIETGRDTFASFLLEAKRATYAAQGDEATATSLVPGSKQLEYRCGSGSWGGQRPSMDFMSSTLLASSCLSNWHLREPSLTRFDRDTP
jgi:hypothetical protein